VGKKLGAWAGVHMGFIIKKRSGRTDGKKGLQKMKKKEKMVKCLQ